MIEVPLLVAVMGCPPGRAALFAPHLAAACQRHHIDTPARLAAFLAQIGHESGGLRWVREIATGQAYEGRASLGNTQPGDGPRYLGRGLIQITGRFNYRATARSLQPLGAPDFEAEPEALELPQWAAWSAADYWASRGLNELADAGDFEAITRRINGGLNGHADRIARWKRAQAAIGQAQPSPTTPSPAAGEAQPTEATPMAPLIPILGAALVDIFAPLAKEKIQREISRHTDNPEVAAQVAAAAIETAKAVTGKADPIEAVAEVRKDPALVEQVQASALEELTKLAPVLDRLAELDRKGWQAEEESRAAAARRAADEPWDMTPWLVAGAFAILGSLLLFVGAIAIVQAAKGDIRPEVWAQIAGLIGFATGVGTTIYAYRFGTSKSSSAKDAVISTMARTR